MRGQPGGRGVTGAGWPGQETLPGLGAVFGVVISTATVAHVELMIFGALIVWFLIVEPHGLARLWSIGKQKLRLWPFPH